MEITKTTIMLVCDLGRCRNFKLNYARNLFGSVKKLGLKIACQSLLKGRQMIEMNFGGENSFFTQSKMEGKHAL